MNEPIGIGVPQTITLNDMPMRLQTPSIIDKDSIVYWWVNAQSTCYIGYRICILASGAHRRSVCLFGTQTMPPPELASAIADVFFPDDTTVAQFAATGHNTPPLVSIEPVPPTLSKNLSRYVTATN